MDEQYIEDSATEVNGEEGKKDNRSTLRMLVDLRDLTLVKNYVAFHNRVSAVERGADQMAPEQLELVARWEKIFLQLQKDASKDIAAVVQDLPIVERMTHVRGIGPGIAAKVVSLIDISRADTVSALWRFAGYGVVEGEREKPTRGVKLHYSARLKTTCYLVGSCLLRSKSPYKKIYDDAREYYADAVHTKDCPPCHAKAGEPLKDGHKHQRAMRKMIKFWLAHLWEVWRELEGYPVRNLYAIDHLGHTHYKPPSEFGWGNGEEDKV